MTIAPILQSERGETAAAAAKGRSLWADAFNRLVRNKAAVGSLAVLTTLLLIAVVGLVAWPHEYDTLYRDRTQWAPTFEHWHIFGTTLEGRDMFALTLVGFLVSLSIGLVATAVSLIIGVAWGATAGYAGGRIDQLMMRIVDVIYSLPYVFIVILLLAITQEFTTGRPFLKIIIIFAAIGGVEWLTLSRIVRGQTLSIRRREFVEAAEAAGATAPQIIRRHVVPNVLGPVVVYMTLTIPVVILAESFLSFIGLGVQEPLTSLGSLIKQGSDNVETMPWTLIAPALTMMVTLLCFNFIGDGVRDALDPKDR